MATNFKNELKEKIEKIKNSTLDLKILEMILWTSDAELAFIQLFGEVEQPITDVDFEKIEVETKFENWNIKHLMVEKRRKIDEYSNSLQKIEQVEFRSNYLKKELKYYNIQNNWLFFKKNSQQLIASKNYPRTKQQDILNNFFSHCLNLQIDKNVGGIHNILSSNPTTERRYQLISIQKNKVNFQLQILNSRLKKVLNRIQLVDKKYIHNNSSYYYDL